MAENVDAGCASAENVRMKTGVYVIVNTVNGKKYVGSASTSFAKRWRNHKHDLERGQHHSSYLQRSWDKYGEQAFVFKAIAITSPDEAVAVEQKFIDELRPEYNGAPIAGSLRGYKHSEKARANMAAGLRAHFNEPGVREKHSARQRKLWARPEYKAIKVEAQNRPETRAKKSATVLKTWQDPEIAARRVAAMKVAQDNDETRARKSRAMKDRWADPLKRAKMMESALINAADPEIRKKVSDGVRAANLREGVCERRASAVRAALSNPESRKKISQAVKAYMSSEKGKKERSDAMKRHWSVNRESITAAHTAAMARDDVRKKLREAAKRVQREASPITVEIAKQITDDLEAGQLGYVLAKKYSTSTSVISAIRRGQHWTSDQCR